jgi:alkylation response protein AidB-like acyl-CoA dehydrogenase
MTPALATDAATTARSASATVARDVPPYAELRRRAAEMVPMLKARAEQTERDRRLSDEVARWYKEAGFARLMQPARFGGYEYGFIEMVELVAEAGRACASSAWVLGLTAVHQWLLGAFPLAAQEEVLDEERDMIICGSYAPACQAIEVPGGFKIKGRWMFASGCDVAGWALLGVMFPAIEENDGKPAAGFLLAPKRDYEIEDNWHTVGLAGTGSKNVLILEDLFVPRHRLLTFPQLSSNNPPGARANPNPLYRIPFLAAVPASIASPALGALQGAIEDFIEMTTGRVTRGAVAGGGLKMAEFQTIQLRLAEAEACLDAATLLLKRDIDEVQTTVATGGQVDVAKRIRNRRDHAFALKLVRQGIDVLYESVGGAGLHLDTGVQRAWRDIHAVSKHYTFGWDGVGSMYGQFRLGLEPKGQY